MGSLEFANFVAGFCAVYSLNTATVFFKKQLLPFIAVSLLMLNWARLMPFYSQNSGMQLFAAFGGFLLLGVGGLLLQEARVAAAAATYTPRNSPPMPANALLRFGMYASLPVIAPSGPWVKLSPDQREMLLATILDVVGYASVAFGMYMLRGRRHGIAMIAILAVYSLGEILYTYQCWPPVFGSGIAMPPAYRMFFSAMNVIFTVYFYYLSKPQAHNPVDWGFKYTRPRDF